MQAIARERLRLVATLIQRAGPYLLLELLLPGGTLFALLLFLYRRSRRDASSWPVTIREQMVAMVREARSLLSLPGVAGWPRLHAVRDGLEPLAMAPGC